MWLSSEAIVRVGVVADRQRCGGTATSISYHAITEISQYHIMSIMDLGLSIMESKYHIMYHDIHATLHV